MDLLDLLSVWFCCGLAKPSRAGTNHGMAKRRRAAQVILWAVRWYLMFPISYRDLELMLADRGVTVDHTTVFRWIQVYAPEIEKRIRPHLRPSNGSWRVGGASVRGAFFTGPGSGGSEA